MDISKHLLYTWCMYTIFLEPIQVDISRQLYLVFLQRIPGTSISGSLQTAILGVCTLYPWNQYLVTVHLIPPWQYLVTVHLIPPWKQYKWISSDSYTWCG